MNGLKTKGYKLFLYNIITIGMLIGIIPIPAAIAVPTDYEIFLTANPTNLLGMFTVDPDLANPVGISEVQMSALTISEEIPPFGDLTVTLADVYPANQSSFRSIFSDSNISEIAGIGPGSLPGIDFFLDFTPKGDPTNINLNAIGTFAFDATDGIVFGDSATGSIGIREANPVPEPSVILLLTSGLAILITNKRNPR